MLKQNVKPIAILFGAGASARLKYPMVTEFFSHCRDAHFDWFYGELYSKIWETIRSNDPAFEGVNYCDANAEVLFSVVQQMFEMVPFGFGRGSNPSITDLYKGLCRAITEIYGKPLSQQPAESDPLLSLLKLADDLSPQAEALKLFTTNYDTVIEDSLREWTKQGRIFERMFLKTGFESEWPRHLKLKTFDVSPPAGKRAVNIVKMHGSPTWKRQTSAPNSPITEADTRVYTDQNVVLYFGYKRFPEEEPYVGLHRLFRKAILQPLTLVAVGYQFGDPYLRELVDIALEANKELSVLCCLKDEPADQSAVRVLERSHRERFKLLRDEQGKLVPFGDEELCTVMTEQLEVSKDST